MPAQSMREQLEEAFNEDQEETGAEEEAGGSVEDTEEPLGDTTEESAGEKDEEEGGGDDSEGEPASKDAEGSVDAKGKGVSGAAKEQDTSESASSVKPPASWKPNAREHWDKVPVEAQREIARREKHMDNMIRESADSRKHQTDFNQLIQPFQGLIEAQQSTPFQAVHNLMQTAAGLTLGTPTQKAQVVSNIMKQYNIDVEELDRVLVGQGGGGQGQGDPGFQAALQQELAPIRQFMGDISSQRQNYQENQQYNINTEIDTFAVDPKNEFFEDVREDMADLMEMASNRGEAMTIQESYDRACRMDPAIYDIVSKRGAADTAAGRKKTIAQKRLAASSIQGNAVGSQEGQGPTTIRGAITDAWDDSV